MRRCNECHSATPTNAAPAYVRTDSYEDIDGGLGARTLAASMNARANNPANPMPPLTREQLTSAEVAAIGRWVANGAPFCEDQATEDTGSSVGADASE